MLSNYQDIPREQESLLFILDTLFVVTASGFYFVLQKNLE